MIFLPEVSWNINPKHPVRWLLRFKICLINNSRALVLLYQVLLIVSNAPGSIITLVSRKELAILARVTRCTFLRKRYTQDVAWNSAGFNMFVMIQWQNKTSYQRFGMRARRKDRFCLVLTRLPRLYAFLNKRIFDSRLYSNNSYLAASCALLLQFVPCYNIEMNQYSLRVHQLAYCPFNMHPMHASTWTGFSPLQFPRTCPLVYLAVHYAHRWVT